MTRWSTLAVVLALSLSFAAAADDPPPPPDEQPREEEEGSSVVKEAWMVGGIGYPYVANVVWEGALIKPYREHAYRGVGLELQTGVGISSVAVGWVHYPGVGGLSVKLAYSRTWADVFGMDRGRDYLGIQGRIVPGFQLGVFKPMDGRSDWLVTGGVVAWEF